jgi:cytochrome c oxidase subunit III
MSTISIAVPQVETPWSLPSKGRVGMFSLIVAESAIFTIFVVAYIFYIGKSLTGPTPQLVLHVPIFNTICLLSSSLTIHLAVRALRAGKTVAFTLAWLLTFVLGAIFIIGTGREWHHLIYEEGLSITTNLFGTTYYSLVGLHAFHVTVGLLALGTVLLLMVVGKVRQEHAERLDVLSLYWHFVDTVWVVVFTVVYIIGR